MSEIFISNNRKLIYHEFLFISLNISVEIIEYESNMVIGRKKLRIIDFDCFIFDHWGSRMILVAKYIRFHER